MATSSNSLICLLVCTALVFSCISEAYILPLEESQLSRDGSVLQHREKRYTDYQERASAFCTGICMYEQRETYSDCFDLCNWYAFRIKPSSPIARQIAINRARKPPPATTPRPRPTPSRQDSLQNNMQQLLRIGGLPAQRQTQKQKSRQKSKQKSRGRSGRRKSKSQRKMRVKAKPLQGALRMERTKNKSSADKEDCNCSNENRHTPIF